MIILVDMDDTIENMAETLIAKTNEQFNQNATIENLTDWSFSSAFPDIDEHQVLALMDKPGFWKDVKPVDGAAKGLKHFMDEGHEVYIVTNTEYNHVFEKMTSVLFKYFPFLSWEQVIITAKKQMIRGDVLIDDGIVNLEGGSYQKILLTMPYNINYDAEANGMIRVHNWDDIVREIDKMAISSLPFHH